MKKIVNRLIQCILTLFIVSVLCFALTKAAPGDPVLTYVEPNMSEEYIQNLRESLGLTKPVYEQYFLWLGRILNGNQHAAWFSHCHCTGSVFRKE